MTKVEARAILKCQEEIHRSISKCMAALKGDTLTYADAYWCAHILSAIDGRGYGSAPIGTATAMIEA